MSDHGSEQSLVRTKWFVPAVLIGIGLFAVLGRSHGPSMVGKPAPDFVLPVVANPSSLGGGGVNATLSQLRGHPVVLDFWATWCPPCRAEVPILEKVSRAWQSQGIVLLGVNVDGLDQGDPRAFAEKHAITYPIVQDASGRVSRAYGIDTLPTVVVVSRDGSILSVQSGVVGEDELGDLVRPAL